MCIWSKRDASWRVALVVVGVVVLTGCAAPKVMPLTSSGNQFGTNADEAKLIADGGKLHDELTRKGMLLETEALTAYVERVGRPLVPAGLSDSANIRFNILRTPEVNAYAVANGDVYLSVGLLARLENESQLAEVIAHEVSHVVLRHSLTSLETRRSNIIAAHIADLFLFGSSIAYLPFLASNAYYSREQEEEADRHGMETIISAGYDPEEAMDIFTVMQEVKKGEEVKGSAYSSHPTNRQREEAMRSLLHTKFGNAPMAPRLGGAGEYAKFRSLVMVENLELKLTSRQYELAREAAEKAAVLQPNAAWPFFYKGEAYRHMADDPKGAARENAWLYGRKETEAIVKEFENQAEENYSNAERAYMKALERDQAYMLAERGLGLVFMKTGNNKSAREKLSRYLAGGNEIKDRQYVANLLKGIPQ